MTTTEAPRRRSFHRRLHFVLSEAWRIAKPYWFSEEKWSALGLLALRVWPSHRAILLSNYTAPATPSTDPSHVNE